MKLVKTLGLLVVAAALIPMAFAGTASAAATSPTGTSYSGEVIRESEGSVVLDNPIAKIECDHIVKSKLHVRDFWFDDETIIETHLINCKNSWHATVVAAGSGTISTTSGYNGTISSSGLTIEATRFGVTCRYATSKTKLGTLTGGAPATLHIEAAIPFHSGSFLCGEGATTMTGSEKVTSPSSLYVG